jgi:hypothetical protein
MAKSESWCAWFDNEGKRHDRPAPRSVDDPALGACLRYAGGVIGLSGTTSGSPPLMTWVPDATKWLALNAATNMIRGDLGADRIRLRFYIAGWAEELLNSEEIFQRLDYIEEIANRPVDMTPRIRALDTSPDEQSVARSIETKVRDNAIDDIILYDVIEPGRLRYAHIGGRTLFANVCTAEEVSETVGKDDLIDPADNGFGDAVTRAYRSALESNRPVVDLVTAPVRIGGRERRWLHYKRITVPLLSLGKLAVFTDPMPSQRISFE